MSPAHKWLVIARNEYRIHTSRIRRIRSYFPYLVIGVLTVYVALIAPRFVNLFIEDFLAFLLSQAALAMIEIILFIVFFYFIILPITYTLKEVQTGQLEILLASPIKPSDVLLGEFLGAMPLYAIVVAFITGSFTAALNPLGLDILQNIIIVTVFVVTLFSGLWIGTVIAAILRTKLGKSARGRDIGRALAMIIALPMIGAMYAIMGGGLLEALANPETSGIIRSVLSLLPSSWGAEVVIGFASYPGNIAAVGFHTLSRFLGLLTFFLGALWLGAKAANRAYSLELTTFTASRAKPNGLFYKTVKFFGGGRSFGILLMSVFKDYSRRLENLSKIAYMVGILLLVNVFLVQPDDPEAALIMPLFILPLLAAFVVGEVTLRGKENLFIYKKTPHGVGRLVYARLLHGWLVVIPIAVTISAVSTILVPQNTLISLLGTIGLVALIVAANVAFVLGLSLLNPAFSDKSGTYVLNIMIVMQALPIGVFLVPLIFLDLGLYRTLLFVTVPLNWLVGVVFLFLGKGKLSRIE